MRLKEIKPGMVIHCKTNEEIKVINDLGYKLISGQKIDSFIEQECYVIVRNEYIVDWTRDYDTAIDFGTIVEFSDLILTELTPEETLRVFGEICAGVCCSRCPFDSIKGDSDCTTFLLEHYKEAAEICAQWKSEHEKKEPEIEWVYRVFGAENYGEKFFQTEEEAIKRCEELVKSQKTKQYARYERVCMVKAVE